MKDKLRELAERWAERIGGEPSTTITSKEVCELLAILDAEGDDGAVAWMTHHDEPMLFLSHEEAASYCDDDEPPIPLYIHPARSGVVSDEDVVDACEYYDANREEGSQAEFMGMRAALQSMRPPAGVVSDEPTIVDDLQLRLIEAIEERDHWKQIASRHARQGDAVAWQYRRTDGEEGPSPYWHDMTKARYELFRDAPRSGCEIRQLYTSPPAMPEQARQVPDGWQQVYSIPENCQWADESDHGRFSDTQKFLEGFGLVIAAPPAPSQGDKP